MSHRQDINTLASNQRQTLATLMLQYLTDDIVDDHMQIIHSGLEIFTGHRAYIAGMETWLGANGGAAFLPLPAWDSATPIPAEFNVVKAEDDGTPRPPLVNLNPNIPKPVPFRAPDVCSFDDPAALGNAINGWHGSVHCAIGGTMCNIMIASAAPIFWCWHAFVDEIYWDWQHCTVPCPDVVGDPLPIASRALRSAGLRVGQVARLPRLVLPERFPMPFPRPLPVPPRPFRMADANIAEHAHGNGHARGEAGGRLVETASTRRGAGTSTPGTATGVVVPETLGPAFARASATFGHDMGGEFEAARLLRGPLVLSQSVGAGVSVPIGRSIDLTVVEP